MEPGQEWIVPIFLAGALICLGIGALIKSAVESGIRRFNKKFGIEVKDDVDGN